MRRSGMMCVQKSRGESETVVGEGEGGRERERG